MSRIFLSHSSSNNREAIALKQWLAAQNPRLANEIFLDLDIGTGIHIGQRWREALNRAAARCEGVVCLLSKEWEASEWCRWEYTYAVRLGKRVFCVRLESGTGSDLRDWQQCDLFVGEGGTTTIDIGDGEPVVLGTYGLRRLKESIGRSGIGSDSFVWPVDDPDRAPYRGWRPFEPEDAGIFCGRDAQILSAMDAVRGMRHARTKQWFLIGAVSARASHRSCALGSSRGCSAMTVNSSCSRSSALNTMFLQGRTGWRTLFTGHDNSGISTRSRSRRLGPPA